MRLAMMMLNNDSNGATASLATTTTSMFSSDAAAAEYNTAYNTNFTDHLTLGPRRDSLNIILPVTIIYVAIFITGTIGNISTCIVIKVHRSLHTATNYYLFSLAISDFMLLLSGVPHEIYSIWFKYPYIFGEFACIGRGLIAETSANATILTITAFTVERYVAICHPFFGRSMSKLSRAIRTIMLIWFVAICAAIPQVAQFGIVQFEGVERCAIVRIIVENSFQLATYAFFIVPMAIIMLLYLLIGIHLYRARLMRRDTVSPTTPTLPSGLARQSTATMKSVQSDTALYRYSSSRGTAGGSTRGSNNQDAISGNQSSTRRVLNMLVAVVICFFLCWAPFHAQRLFAMYGSSAVVNEDIDTDSHRTIYAAMTYVSGVLYYLSTCINPLLYNLMSNKFRQAFKAVLFGKKSTGSMHSYRRSDSRTIRRNTELTIQEMEASDSVLPATGSLLKNSRPQKLSNLKLVP